MEEFVKEFKGGKVLVDAAAGQVLLLQGSCSVVLASEGPPLLGVKQPVLGEKSDHVPQNFTSVDIAQASGAQTPPPPSPPLHSRKLQTPTSYRQPPTPQPRTLCPNSQIPQPSALDPPLPHYIINFFFIVCIPSRSKPRPVPIQSTRS